MEPAVQTYPKRANEALRDFFRASPGQKRRAMLALSDAIRADAKEIADYIIAKNRRASKARP